MAFQRNGYKLTAPHSNHMLIVESDVYKTNIKVQKLVDGRWLQIGSVLEIAHNHKTPPFFVGHLATWYAVGNAQLVLLALPSVGLRNLPTSLHGVL